MAGEPDLSQSLVPAATAALDAAALERLGLKDHGCDQLTVWIAAAGAGDPGYPAHQLTLPAYKSGRRTTQQALSIAKAGTEAQWRPETAYAELKPKTEAIGKALALTGVTLRYSAYDFAAANAASGATMAEVDAIGAVALALAPDWPHKTATLRAGMNFAGQAELLLDLDAAFRKRIGLDRSVAVAGCVGKREDGYWIEVATRLNCPPLALMGGTLKVALTRASLAAERIDPKGGAPEFTLALHGTIDVDGQRLEVMIAVNPGTKTLRLIGEAPSLLKAQGLIDSLAPDFGKALREAKIPTDRIVPSLRRIELQAALTGLDGARAALWLSYADPFTLFNLIEITPSAYLALGREGGKTVFEAEISGKGIVHAGEQKVGFETMLALPSGQFSAGLAEGSVVALPKDIQAKLEKVMRGQSLTLFDLSIRGAPRLGNYSLSIGTLGFLAFPVGKGRLLIGDVQFEVSKTGRDVSARLEAALGIGDVEAAIEIELDGEMTASFAMPRLPIGAIAADLLQIEAPGELAQAEIEDLKVNLTLGDKTKFDFSAKSRSMFQIAGLEAGLTEFSAGYADALTLKGKGRIKLDTAEIALELSYEKENWNFSFGADTDFNLSAVLGKLADTIGFKSPIKSANIRVTRAAGAFRLGPKGTRIALNFEFKVGGGDFRLTLVAAQRTGKGETGWHHSLKAGPVAIDLRGLPLLGAPIGKAADALAGPGGKNRVALDELTVLLLSTVGDDAVTALFDGLDAKDFPKPADAGGKVSLTGKVRLLEYEKPIAYPDGKGEKKEEAAKDEGGRKAGDGKAVAPAPPAAEGAKPAVKDADAPSWIDLKRDIGPVRIDRIGVALDSAKKLSVQIDAGAKIGPIEARVMSLEVRTPVLDGFDPKFALGGLELSCKTEAFTLSGALLANPKVPNDYAGAIAISFRKVAIKAIGAYSEQDGRTSLFVFAAVLAPLFAAPPFALTGIAGGFGMNMIVKLPERPQDVAGFPLIAMMRGGDAAPEGGMLGQLEKFRTALERVPGGWCVAFGLTFTLAQMVECVALAVLEIRKSDIAISFAGLADLPLRVGKPPADKKASPKALGHLQLAITARYSSAEKIVRVLGALTDKSWLIDPACRLTGGFAVCAWLGGPHEGDFLVSIGGYSPFLKPRSHYPAVERVGLTWSPREGVTISGGVYLTLDRYSIQFGLAARLLAETPKLTVSAYFSLDALLQWQPLYFQLRIQMGCMVDVRAFIRLRISLDIDMEAWGPSFGAELKVAVSLGLITLRHTVSIGAERAPAPTATITEVLALASSGRASPIAITGAPEAGVPIRAEMLELNVALSVPAREIDVVGATLAPEARAAMSKSATKPVDIRPMQLVDLESKLTLTVKRDGKLEPAAQWQVDPVLGTPTEAIWYLPAAPTEGSASQRKLKHDELLASPSGRKAITGLRIAAPFGTLRGLNEVKLAPDKRIGPAIAAPANAAAIAAAPIAAAALATAGFDLAGCAW